MKLLNIKQIFKKCLYTCIENTCCRRCAGEGYDGITKETLFEIEDIIKRNYELVDPDLNSIIWSIKKRN